MSPFSEPFLSEFHREEWEAWKKEGEKRQFAQLPMSPAEFIAQVERLQNQKEDAPSKSGSAAKPLLSASGPSPAV
jgi:hypothetical protein